MKSYRLFASTYENVDIMLASRLRDEALEVHNNSALVVVQVDTMNEALENSHCHMNLLDFLREKVTTSIKWRVVYKL